MSHTKNNKMDDIFVPKAQNENKNEHITESGGGPKPQGPNKKNNHPQNYSQNTTKSNDPQVNNNSDISAPSSYYNNDTYQPVKKNNNQQVAPKYNKKQEIIENVVQSSGPNYGNNNNNTASNQNSKKPNHSNDVDKKYENQQSHQNSQPKNGSTQNTSVNEKFSSPNIQLPQNESNQKILRENPSAISSQANIGNNNKNQKPSNLTASPAATSNVKNGGKKLSYDNKTLRSRAQYAITDMDLIELMMNHPNETEGMLSNDKFEAQAPAFEFCTPEESLATIIIQQRYTNNFKGPGNNYPQPTDAAPKNYNNYQGTQDRTYNNYEDDEKPAWLDSNDINSEDLEFQEFDKKKILENIKNHNTDGNQDSTFNKNRNNNPNYNNNAYNNRNNNGYNNNRFPPNQNRNNNTSTGLSGISRNQNFIANNKNSDNQNRYPQNQAAPNQNNYRQNSKNFQSQTSIQSPQNLGVQTIEDIDKKLELLAQKEQEDMMYKQDIQKALYEIMEKEEVQQTEQENLKVQEIKHIEKPEWDTEDNSATFGNSNSSPVTSSEFYGKELKKSNIDIKNNKSPVETDAQPQQKQMQQQPVTTAQPLQGAHVPSQSIPTTCALEIQSIINSKPFSGYYQRCFFGTYQNQEGSWYYIDLSDVTQGPFASANMDEWYESNYFKDTLQVFCRLPFMDSKFVEQKNFFPLMFIKQSIANSITEEYKQMMENQPITIPQTYQNNGGYPPFIGYNNPMLNYQNNPNFHSKTFTPNDIAPQPQPIINNTLPNYNFYGNYQQPGIPVPYNMTGIAPQINHYKPNLGGITGPVNPNLIIGNQNVTNIPVHGVYNTGNKINNYSGNNYPNDHQYQQPNHTGNNGNNNNNNNHQSFNAPQTHHQNNNGGKHKKFVINDKQNQHNGNNNNNNNYYNTSQTYEKVIKSGQPNTEDQSQFPPLE